MAALCEVFPDARRAGLGRCLGYPAPRAAQAAVIGARRSGWWVEDHVEEVVGALVADRYGEQGK